MVYPYFLGISYRLKKKGEINATKQSWEIGILYTLVRKTKFGHILQKKKDPFQKIAANVAVEEKYPTMIHFLRELFAKTAV